MEHASARIAKNTIFVFLARASDLISGVLTVVLAARYLSVAAFGKYAFIWVIANALSPLVALGCARILIRDISVDRKQVSVFVTSGLVINAVMTLVTCVIAAFIALAFQLARSEAIGALYIALLAQTLLIMTQTVGSVFIAYERMAYNLVITLSTRLLLLLLFALVISLRMGFISLFIAMAFANAIGFVFAFSILVRKFTKPAWGIHSQQLKYILKESLPVALFNFLAQGFMYINVFLLKIFQDFVQVSYFQAPQRIIGPLMLFPISFLLAFAPSVSRLANDDISSSNLKYAYNKALKYMLIIILPVCVYGTIYASSIVSLLFGDEFSNATGSFQILMWAFVPFSLNTLLNLFLTSMKKQKMLVISHASCLLLNVLLGPILIRHYGHIGASLTFLFSIISLFIANSRYLIKYIGSISLHRILWQPLLACSILCLCLFPLVDEINMVALIVCSLVLYISLLFIFKTFTTDEIELFKRAILKKSKQHGEQPVKWIRDGML